MTTPMPAGARERPRLASTVHALRVTIDTDEELPALEVRLYGQHEERERTKAGNLKRNAKVIGVVPAYVRVGVSLPVELKTRDTRRLRRMAQLLEHYADVLDALNMPVDATDGVEQLTIDTLTTQEPAR